MYDVFKFGKSIIGSKKDFYQVNFFLRQPMITAFFAFHQFIRSRFYYDISITVLFLNYNC
jgi:hypothetical protein